MNFNSNRWNRWRYSLYTPIYDLVGNVFRQARQGSIAQLDLQPSSQVLIVGAGTGLDLEFIARDVNVTATDLTPSMVRRIEQRADNVNAPNVNTQVMDGQVLEFPDGHFDAVILHLILAVIPDPETCLREAARVLKTGGHITIYDKFLPLGKRISLRRKLANGLTRVLFSELNRQLEPLVDSVPELHILRDEVDSHFVIFRTVLLKKTF
jgi:ubiquinone/menaquinone biosynthesis C-methylase UbiE